MKREWERPRRSGLGGEREGGRDTRNENEYEYEYEYE